MTNGTEKKTVDIYKKKIKTQEVFDEAKFTQ